MSQLLVAQIDGKPLTEEELLNYCELIVEAGNETTRNAISGGLLAFSEHRGEWDRLRHDPGLLPTAVEEILRWVSPIIHFTRTATEDCDLRGSTIKAGDRVALFYASANRDGGGVRRPVRLPCGPSPEPPSGLRFRPPLLHGRQPGPGRAGALFRHLLIRLDSFELAASPERLNSAVNGGIKHLRCAAS